MQTTNQALQPLLIVTKTCPACGITTRWLDKQGISYQKIYAEDTPEVATKYHVQSVPQLVVLTSDNQEKVLHGFYEIRDYYS